MRKKTIVIAGAQGQLGQALQHQLSNHHVLAWAKQDLDITVRDAVWERLTHETPDLVINAAAFTQVDDAEANPDEAYKGNALGPQNLAQVTGEFNIPLLHFSTDYVFDGKQDRPYHEFHQPNPLSVYGRSKLAGEEAVRSLNSKHFIVRTAWLYHSVGRSFPHTIARLAKQGEVRIVNDQFGSPTFAPHLARAVSQLVNTGAYGTYHLAGSGGTSWYAFAKIIFQALNIRTPLVPIATVDYPRPAPRPAYAVLTSLQDPTFPLPPWEEGAWAFASEWKD